MSDVYIENPVTIRAAAILAAAWDAAPLEIVCGGVDWITFYLNYIRGAAGGAMDFQIQWSPYAVTIAGVANWFPMTAYATGAVAAGADTLSLTQRERANYGSTAADAENFIHGPIEFRDTAQRVRLLARETGDVQSPGTLHVVAIVTKAGYAP